MKTLELEPRGAYSKGSELTFRSMSFFDGNMDLADKNVRSGDAKVFIVSLQWNCPILILTDFVAGSQHKPKYRDRRAYRRPIHSNSGTRIH